MNCPYCGETLEFYDCFDTDYFSDDQKFDYWSVDCKHCNKVFIVRELWERKDIEIQREIED